MEFSFDTTCKATIRGELLPHEIFALLDWCLGELNKSQTEEYGRRCVYPDSLEDAAREARIQKVRSGDGV